MLKVIAKVQRLFNAFLSKYFLFTVYDPKAKMHPIIETVNKIWTIKKAAPITPMSSGSLPADGREHQRHIIGFIRL